MSDPPLVRAKPQFVGMRGFLAVASILVFIAGFQLFVLSEHTDTFFAWTVKPALTAAFLGAGFWSSCVLEVVAARQVIWARARIAVFAALVFTTMTLFATLLHLDRFHFNSPAPITLTASWAWLIVYVVVPPVLIVLLVFQVHTPGQEPPRERPMPAWFRFVLALQGLVMLVVGLALFFLPDRAASLWPWTLTPLTAQASAAWLIGLSLGALLAVWDNDWWRSRSLLGGYLAFGALQLIALLRYSSDVNWSLAAAWLYLLFLLSVVSVTVYALVASRPKELRSTKYE